MGSGAFLVEACRQLGAALVKAWREHDAMPVLPPDEDESLYAQRIVAQRCLYGVDKNPMATDLAKLSLWLTTLAQDHPFTFLDHSLRSGDSVVGLSARQIAAMHWKPGEQTLFEKFLRERIRAATGARQSILAAREDTAYRLLEQKLGNADDALEPVRWSGDAVVAAFFAGKKRRDRETKRQEYAALHERAVSGRGDLAADEQLREAGERLAAGPKGVAPFHWEIEFPEVFRPDEHLRRTAGFDAIVGNPPFAGKNTLIDGHAEGYLDWLKLAHPESHGNADLVAHFYRRAFELLRPTGRFGLIATKTIRQGDTRSTGLRWICSRGGTIYRARRRLRWPGEATVVVSVVNLARGEVEGPYWLDGREVDFITAYLFHAGGHEDPARLRANDGKSFIGSTVLGMGFTFDDTDKRGVATPLPEMCRLIEKDPRNAERILPYLGGEEVNESPTHAHHRYVINFEDFPLRREELGETWEAANDDRREEWLKDGIVPADYPEPVAADWPDLLTIVEEKVKPDRLAQKEKYGRKYWWRFVRLRPEMRAAVADLTRCIVISRVRATGFTFVSSKIVPSEQLVVFGFDMHAPFCVLQSRVHEIWAHFFSGTALDLVRYAPSDCLETFPFPDGIEHNPELLGLGEAYYRFRAEVMQRRSEGLTKTYNHFHDPNERSQGIARLRELHAGMDRVVLDAYGWTDLEPVCGFFPEFDDEDEDEEDTRHRKRYRYRWPDELHDEVLARLLALNGERAALEAEAEGAVKPKYGSKRTARRSRKPLVPSLPFEGGS